MSKLKEIASQVTDKNTIGNGLKSTQSITPTENVDLFNNVISSAEAEAAADKRRSLNDDSNQTGDSHKVKATKEGEGVSDGEASQATESDKLQDPNAVKEVETINNYQVDVQELARQLNVALLSQQQQQNLPKQAEQINIVVERPEILQNIQVAADKVDPQLLRRVDVKSIKKQLEVVMANQQEVELESPPLEDVQALDYVDAETQVDTKPVAETVFKDEEIKIANFLKADDFNLADLKKLKNEKLPEFLSEKPLDVVSDRAIQKLIEVKPLVDDKRPDVILNVVSVDINRITRLENQEDKEKMFDLFADLLKAADSFGQEKAETAKLIAAQDGPVAGSMPKINNSLNHILPPVAVASPVIDVTKFQPIMSPITVKIEGIVLQMAKDGKSGTTRLQINPPNLGAIDIRFEIKGKNVTAEIITQNPATRELLENQIPHLKEILMAQDMNVEKFSLKNDSEHFKQPPQISNELAQYLSGQSQAQQQQGNEARAEQLAKLKDLLAQRYANNRSSIDVVA